ncbi:HAMP domain-containing protein [bacterium]|nr:MAG: HAMP domain-containing protein [bacterium]
MKNLKILLGFLILSIFAIFITGIVLSYIGVEHGPLLVKTGFVFLIVNVLLYLLFLIFSVIRTLFHFYVEKKQKLMGSKFRTQLVVSFLGLILIPASLLFILSNQLINSSIDKWFSLEVQQPVIDSMDVAKTFYSNEKEFALDYANILASQKNLIDIEKSAAKKQEKFNVFLHRKPVELEVVRNAFNGNAGTDIESTEKGDIIRAAVPVRNSGKISGVVVVETIIPRNIVSKMETINKAYNEYSRIKLHQDPIRFLYFLMLTIATLLIIFLALWVSLRIAKGITVPIRSLAEATETVAQGDMNFRIDFKRDDEIGLLINSFNNMLDDLQQGKLSLEKAYTESDRRRLSMEAILENIKTGVIFLERSGRIATLNNAACSMLNIEKTDFLNKSHRELLAKIKSDELDAMVKRLDDKSFKAANREIHAYIDGRPVDFRVYLTVLKSYKGSVIGFLVVFDDLTEVIKAQRALAWQEVAKRITHEIKNPLTPIKLSTERVLKKWDEKASDFGEVLRKSTGTIVKQVDSLIGMVNEFSRFGKMPKINLEPANINSIIEEVVELYSNMKEIEISKSLEDLPEIDLDREQFKRALINLIDNAIQAKTKRIWLYTSYDPSLEIANIEVVDEGIGIGDEEKDKLFLPHFSTRKEGTGLGLTIVNSIVSKHRGYIRVKDNVPQGSRFIIELPVGRK